MQPPLCRHCQQHTAHRPRGLCWKCYYTPGVKDLYPLTSKYSRRGVGSHYRTGAAEPPKPTAWAPRTPEKVQVLEERAAMGVALWHPADADEETGLGVVSRIDSRGRKGAEFRRPPRQHKRIYRTSVDATANGD